MVHVMARMDPSGRIVIPRDLREALGVPEGGELRLRVENGELRATTRLSALRRIQAEVKATRWQGASPVEELIAERRADAARGLQEEQVPAPLPPDRAPRRGKGG
jgi:bifunctional DNA-binding transcriptional regulator/antitoxin component of YhaV-PrlF toxin-antitoxin module